MIIYDDDGRLVDNIGRVFDEPVNTLQSDYKTIFHNILINLTSEFLQLTHTERRRRQASSQTLKMASSANP